MTNASAQLNYLRMAPRKVRLVVDVIRGMSASEAEAQLMMMTKRAAPAVLKLLRSVMANAKAKNMSGTKLMVASIRVDQGPTLKRSLPRAKGMATPIHKKSSHITIVLGEAAKDFSPRFAFVSRVKKDAGIKKEVKAKVAGAKGKPIMKDAKKVKDEPGFMRRVFRRKVGE